MAATKNRAVERASRRKFLSEVSALSALSLLGPGYAAAEPPPETKTIRLVKVRALCLAPQYVAEELLRLEGFSDVQYVTLNDYPGNIVYSGKADFTQDGVSTLLPAVDKGQPVVALAGVHAGCYELIAHEHVRSIHDLKGKRVIHWDYGDPQYLMLASVLAYVGIDPRKDIQWVTAKAYTNAYEKMLDLFIEKKADAIMGFTPQPQLLRARKIGHVILNTATDRPWSEYFCCIIVGHRDFVARYPVATKRAIRAFLKAADVCARNPEQAAQLLVAKGYEPDYELALSVLKELPYNRWREADPEDTMRFFALRLREVGIVKSTPQQLLARGTNWGFFNELKRELKT